MKNKKCPTGLQSRPGCETERASHENTKKHSTNRKVCQTYKGLMRMENDKPGYWAVIPAKVRYDETLRPNAKLLYAEITALANAEGYCWASNERIADWYGISPKTVGSLIRQLAQHGYVTVELLHDATNAITGRRIWIDRPEDNAPPLLKNEDTPLKNEDTPVLKNGEDNNTRANNNPPKAPQGGPRVKKPKKKGRKKEKLACDWEPEIFERFWNAYPRGEGKAAARWAWDELKPDRKLMMEMSDALTRQKKTEEWRRGVGVPWAVRWLTERRWEWSIGVKPEADDEPNQEKEGDDVWL